MHSPLFLSFLFPPLFLLRTPANQAGVSLQTLLPLLSFLTDPPPGLPLHFELGVACIGPLNTQLSSPSNDAEAGTELGGPFGGGRHTLPVVLEAGFEPRSGGVFPAKFEDRGPAPLVRAHRLACRPPGLWPTWDGLTGCVLVTPFTPPVRPQVAAALLALGDVELLKACSTSPNAEPKHFCGAMRAAQRLLLEHGGDLTGAFDERKGGDPEVKGKAAAGERLPLAYRHAGDAWVRVPYAEVERLRESGARSRQQGQAGAAVKGAA